MFLAVINNSFDCTHLESRDRAKCYYKGSTLKVGESVDASLLKGSCVGLCDCAENRFICALKSCAENFGPHLEPGCVRQYSSDECCSTGVVCGNLVTGSFEDDLISIILVVFQVATQQSWRLAISRAKHTKKASACSRKTINAIGACV